MNGFIKLILVLGGIALFAGGLALWSSQNDGRYFWGGFVPGVVCLIAASEVTKEEKSHGS